MSKDVEHYLEALETDLRAKFPEVGLLVYAVVDCADNDEQRNVICLTNMTEGEIEEIHGLVGPDDFVSIKKERAN